MQHHGLLQHLFGTLNTSLSKKLHANRLEVATTRRILLQESPLAGFQYHRAAGVWPFLRIGERVQLRREPANPHDTNAIAIWFRNEHLGYVPRRENLTLARMMDRGERLEARIIRLREEDNPWRRIRLRIDLRANPF